MKTVLITGASSGIGREFVRRYAERNYRIIMCSRSRDKMEKLAEELNIDHRIIAADLTSEEECHRLLQELEDEKIDVFINNAGFGLAGSFLETDLQREIDMVRINDIAMHILFKEILKRMQKADEGTILNVASSAGFFPGGPYMATYYASKAYILSLTRAVHRELKEKKSNVRVYALCPGPVDTNFNRNANVIFALKGISAEKCVDECLKMMEGHNPVIIPDLAMKAVYHLRKLVPDSLLTMMVGHQQKKKIY
ncbi:MAG: SDR family oxidoreductase [Erysipelotrichaceae bacterium]|nr:SDR family oxidoreductase [Erysipelotrichaceae bacterium]